MHARRLVRFLCGTLFMFLVLSVPLEAVQQGRISGDVRDDKGAPLPDVRVTITTKAITNFRIVLKTDKNGHWGTILNDATLTYHYQFEKDGYVPTGQDKKVPIGASETLDVELLTQTRAVEKGVVKRVEDPFAVAYNAAVEAVHANDLEAAFAKAQEAIRLGPDKANAYDLGAKIAAMRRDWDQAVLLGEKSMSLEPDNTQMIAILTEAYRAKGDKVKTAEYEKKYVAANPDQPEVLYNQAVTLYNKNDFKGAEPLLKRVVESKPDFAKAHYLLGMSYVNLNNIPEMKKEFAEYLRLDPKGADAGTAREMLDAFK